MMDGSTLKTAEEQGTHPEVTDGDESLTGWNEEPEMTDEDMNEETPEVMPNEDETEAAERERKNFTDYLNQGAEERVEAAGEPGEERGRDWGEETQQQGELNVVIVAGNLLIDIEETREIGEAMKRNEQLATVTDRETEMIYRGQATDMGEGYEYIAYPSQVQMNRVREQVGRMEEGKLSELVLTEVPTMKSRIGDLWGGRFSEATWEKSQIRIGKRAGFRLKTHTHPEYNLLRFGEDGRPELERNAENGIDEEKILPLNMVGIRRRKKITREETEDQSENSEGMKMMTIEEIKAEIKEEPDGKPSDGGEFDDEKEPSDGRESNGRVEPSDGRESNGYKANSGFSSG